MKNNMDEIVNYAKNYGFVFQGSEIYGGLANSWDYGPLGTLLKENIRSAWKKKFIQEKAQIWQYKCHIKTVCPKCKDSAISKKKGLYQQSNRNRYAPGCRTSCQYGNKSSPYCMSCCTARKRNIKHHSQE